MTTDPYRRLFPVTDLPPGGGMPVQVDGRTIAVFNVAGSFHAVENECPHRGGSLSDGALLGSVVVCPLHRWQFNLESGESPMNPQLCVKRFPLEIRGGDLWINPN